VEAELTTPHSPKKVAAIDAIVRILSLLVAAAPAALLAGTLMFLVRVGPVEQWAIGLAIGVAALCAVGCSTRPPVGRSRLAVKAGFYAVAYPAVAIAGIAALVAGLNEQSSSMGLWLLPLYPGLIFSLHSLYERCTTNPAAIED